MSGNTGEKLAFWLTLEEKSSIEADINAKKPIGDTPAYKKFLKAVFPNKTLSFPYLANYDDAVIVVSKLSKLFGKSVRLPYEDEAIESLKVNNHLTGFRNSCDDRIVNVDDEGDAWLSGETQDTCAPCASLDCDGISRLDTSLLRNGHSVIPIFG